MAAKYCSSSSDESDGPEYEIDCNTLVYNSDGEAEVLCYTRNDTHRQNPHQEYARIHSNQSANIRSRHSSTQSNKQFRTGNPGEKPPYFRQASTGYSQKNQPPHYNKSNSEFALKEYPLPRPLKNNNASFSQFQKNQSSQDDSIPRGDFKRGGISQESRRGRCSRKSSVSSTDTNNEVFNPCGDLKRGGTSRDFGRGRGRGSRGRGSTGRGSKRSSVLSANTNNEGSNPCGDSKRGGTSRDVGRGRGSRGRGSTGRGTKRSSVSCSDAKTNTHESNQLVMRSVSHPSDSQENLECHQSENQAIRIEVHGNASSELFALLRISLEHVGSYSFYDNVNDITVFHLNFVSKKQAFKAVQIINSRRFGDITLKAEFMPRKELDAETANIGLIRTISTSSDVTNEPGRPSPRLLYLFIEGKVLHDDLQKCFEQLRGLQSFDAKHDDKLNVTIVTLTICGKKTAKAAKQFLLSKDTLHSKVGRVLNYAHSLIEYNNVINKLKARTKNQEENAISKKVLSEVSEPTSGQHVYIRVDGQIQDNFDEYLHTRIGEPIDFDYLKEKNEFFPEVNRSIAVLLFQSKTKAVRGMRLIHEANRTCPTKLLCRLIRNEIDLFDQQIEIQEKNETLYNKHRKEIQKRIDDYMGDHEIKISKVQRELQSINDKLASRKNFSIEEFSYLNDQKKALDAKSIELDNQKLEFEKYTDNMLQLFDNFKNEADFEKKIPRIRVHFGVECRRFSTALPMYSKRSAILEQVSENPISIVIGETGSGKSTQMVQYLHDARHVIFSSVGDTQSLNKPIVCTQPRKIAAMTVAKRVADEMGTSFGDVVSFQSNIYCKRSENNKIIFMTDYVLLHECAKDPNLSDFSCVIIDEAHERSVYTDLLIALLKRTLISSQRDDLKVVITSATIDPEVFVRFFKPLHCPVLHVSGRAFPVEIIYDENEDEIDFKDQTRKSVAKALEVHNSHKNDGYGAILVFVTTPHEAEDCCDQFKILCKGQNDCFCLPLHGKLQPQDQQKVFAPCPPNQRKVVFATNAAETSVTIPEVKYVIDTGLVKEMEYDAVRNMNTLNVNMVTRSSADQRKGRAGRTGPGKCYRLYSLTTYQSMEVNTKPEILRIHLGLALIKLLVLRIDPDHFDFVDAPPKDMIDAAFDSLCDLGAIHQKQITILGEWLGKLPFDPYIGSIVYHGVEEGIGLIGLIFAALASAPGSVFYSGGNDNEQRKAANNLRLKFCDEDGDLFSYFQAYRAWHQTPDRNRKAFCMANSLNNKVLSQVEDTVKEIRNTLKKEMNVIIEFRPDDPLEIEEHKPLLKHFLLRIFRRKLSHYLGHRKAGYLSIHQDQVLHLFPTCSLKSLGLDCDWLIYTYAMQTSCRYGMNVTLLTEENVIEAIENGTVDIDIDDVKKRRIKECCVVLMGKFTFNEFVGPRFSCLRKLENEFQSNHPDCTVVLEADKDQGILRFMCNSKDPTIENSISNSVSEKANSIKQKFLLEQDEQTIAGSFRAILGRGGGVIRILTPEEFCTVSIHSKLPESLPEIKNNLVENTFGIYGKIVSIRCTQRSRNRTSTLWGFLTFEVPEAAKKAVEDGEIPCHSCPEIELIAKRQGYFRPTNFSEKFKARVSWIRRPSKGCALVIFSEVENAGAVLVMPVFIKGTEVSVKPAKSNVPGEVFLNKVPLSADEEDIKQGIMSSLRLHNDPEKVFEKVIVMRNQVNSDDNDLKTLKNRLVALIKLSTKDESFDVIIRTPKPATAKYVAFVTFEKAADGIKACRELNAQTINNQELEVNPVLNTSIFVNKRVYSATKETLVRLMDNVNDDEINRGTADLKTLRSGNFAIDLNVDNNVEYFLRTKASIDEVVNGYRLTCEMDPELRHVFSQQGRRLLTNLEESTKTCILTDIRTLSITIHGTIDNRILVINALREYQNEMANSVVKRIKLSGEGQPTGVAKALMEKYGADCSQLADDCHLISCEVDLKRQLLLLTGNEEAIENASNEVNTIVDSLREIQNVDNTGDNYPECPICFCPVENEVYRLEGCGHAYHLSCLKLHVENAVKSREFPLSCTSDECNELTALCDVKQIAQQGQVNMDEIIKSSVSCFVKHNLEDFHYCNTPDCDAVYRISTDGKKFQCPLCNLIQCTSCHVQWHFGITCAQWKSQAKDVSVEQWIRENPNNRKRCPKCNAPIEKNGGCNHMTCSVCKRHICWLCLKHYSTSQQCYDHLSRRHGGVFNERDLLYNVNGEDIGLIAAPQPPQPRLHRVVPPARNHNVIHGILAEERRLPRPAEARFPQIPAPPPPRPILRNAPIYNPPPIYRRESPPRVREQNGCLIL